MSLVERIEELIKQRGKKVSAGKLAHRILQLLTAERELDLIDQAPPSNQKIEGELVGSLFILCDKKKHEFVFSYLEARDFSDTFWGFLFEELRAAWEASVPWDTEGLLLDWLYKRGTFKKLDGFGYGGVAHLSETTRNEFTFHPEYYSTVLREHRRKRAYVSIAEQLLRHAHDKSKKPEEVETWLNDKLDQLKKLKGIKWPP